jgi:hypothetical protein
VALSGCGGVLIWEVGDAGGGIGGGAWVWVGWRRTLEMAATVGRFQVFTDCQTGKS